MENGGDMEAFVDFSFQLFGPNTKNNNCWILQ